MRHIIAILLGLVCIFTTKQIYTSAGELQFVIAFLGGSLTSIMVSVVRNWEKEEY